MTMVAMAGPPAWAGWTSNGAGFNDYAVWGRGARPQDQLADVNGDGRADVVQLHLNGNAYVWLSTGTSFSTPPTMAWATSLITYDSANSVLLEHVRRAQLAADDFSFW